MILRPWVRSDDAQASIVKTRRLPISDPNLVALGHDLVPLSQHLAPYSPNMSHKRMKQTKVWKQTYENFGPICPHKGLSLDSNKRMKTFKHLLNTCVFIWKIYVSLLSVVTFVAERVRLLYIPIQVHIQAGFNPWVNFVLMLAPACGTRLNFTFEY